ncbi:hypothetical protein FB446DRAFT_705560 [Lentinula raphanica]|nr:hypothetical protein FB446DRAFT_705560 [Lentinula raphanica]
MEPYVDESTDDEASSKSPSVWWKRRTYDFATYRLDSDGMIQKVHHDPHGEELAKTRGRTKTPPPKGGLKKSEFSPSAKDGDRGSTPGGARTSSITNETFGPTKLETTSFKSSDSEGHNAWHSSQSPHDLDAPLPETPTPRMVGTAYVHRNTTDGGYQVWIWCSREGGEFAWYPVDLNNEQFAHPKISNSAMREDQGHVPLKLLALAQRTDLNASEGVHQLVHRWGIGHRKRGVVDYLRVNGAVWMKIITLRLKIISLSVTIPWHVLHEVVESCHLMNTTVSQTLIRDSEGWFVLMDVEESPPAVWHHQEAYRVPSSLMGWRDSEKVIESEDETADHDNGSDSDTESHTSMVQNCPTNSNPLPNRTESEGFTKSVVNGFIAVANDRTPVIRNAVKQLPEQKADENIITSNVEELNTTSSSRDCSTGKGTREDPVISSAPNGVTGIAYVPPFEVVVPYCSPKPAVTKLVEEVDSSDVLPDPNISCNTRESQARVQRSFLLEELLDHLGDFVMQRLPITRVLFKAGSLMYLLFLVRVLQKIWTMFRSQPLAVGFGNLGISVALLFLLRLWVPEHIKVQVDESCLRGNELRKKLTLPDNFANRATLSNPFACLALEDHRDCQLKDVRSDCGLNGHGHPFHYCFVLDVKS